MTGLSGLLCYFQQPVKIGYRDGNKQLEGHGTEFHSLSSIFDEVDVKQVRIGLSASLITVIANVSSINPFRMPSVCRSLRPATLAAALLGLLYCLAMPVQGQGTQPIVAIHDSELTRALETMTASGATPTGPGTTSNQWWITQWHYFVMPDAVKEALRSDGTAFTVVGDSNILAGVLTNADGSPKFPILFSLASEAVDNGEIAQLTNYVAAGGFLFVGSSSFTRTTERDDSRRFCDCQRDGVGHGRTRPYQLVAGRHVYQNRQSSYPQHASECAD